MMIAATRRLTGAHLARCVSLFATLAFLGALNLAGAPRAAAQATVGDPAPDFTITNVLGDPPTARLSDFRGSVVVFAAFAYW
jgi:hypothetical protein